MAAEPLRQSASGAQRRSASICVSPFFKRTGRDACRDSDVDRPFCDGPIRLLSRPLRTRRVPSRQRSAAERAAISAAS